MGETHIEICDKKKFSSLFHEDRSDYQTILYVPFKYSTFHTFTRVLR